MFAQNPKRIINDSPPQIQFEKMVELFYEQNPFVWTTKPNHELEVKFGTKGAKKLTKIDYDNVIKKLKSLGFYSYNQEGEYLLRIQNEYLDPKDGRRKLSKGLRTEIVGFHSIQEYCKTNDLASLISSPAHRQSADFVNKSLVLIDGVPLQDVVFEDFHFSVSYKTENPINRKSPLGQTTLSDWTKSKKFFRYINRVTFTHDKFPINIDISIVKSTDVVNRVPVLAYRTDDIDLFGRPEIYEIELEVNNTKIGPNTEFDSPSKILQAIRKTIKFVLTGLQGTNYPVSYKEQNDVIFEYMRMLHRENFSPEKRIYPTDFIGPSSFTLEMKNVVPLNANLNTPNIRNGYVVTDKADGERNLLFISDTGKIYLINTNMTASFTGAITHTKDLFNTLLDGELVLHDKNGNFINLFAAFDIYYINKVDVRTNGFITNNTEELDKNVFRYPILRNVVKGLQATSIIKGEISPIKIVIKEFYPRNPQDSIFSGCKIILDKANAGLFEYNTDGLIFTPTHMGVGADSIGKAGRLSKTTWDYSFKWKPAMFNTIDFLVSVKKTPGGDDIITPLFEEGMNVSDVSQLSQYKTIILRCGFDETKHGFINPCQNVIDDDLPEYNSNMYNESNYKPVQFYPTSPYDPNAGICKIMLSPDKSGVNQMFTEEGEVFGDNTIVEFRYDLSKEGNWRWIPLRVRYDKTTELRQGMRNFGNAYHVADSNWHSIHNPITEKMITTSLDIPQELNDDNVYYNRVLSSSNTQKLRSFHNCIKKMLITSVAKENDTLIDYACGKGGDFSKWISANLSFVFGIDISKDNLENKLDGACARFLIYRKQMKKVPYALFVNGDCSKNIRSGNAMLNDKAAQITKAVFGHGENNEKRLGKGVARQYGKAQNGFNISSCQFAIHYFFKNQDTLIQFMRNISECTALGGYFIGSSYDGKLLFNMLRKYKEGESIVKMDYDTKIWEVRKSYDSDQFNDDASCLGYQIDVFQESINKMFPEYLVNYDYLNRIMENYGFKLITRDEARTIGLPDGSGLFGELFTLIEESNKKGIRIDKDCDNSLGMRAFEKQISFLNRYFVYKKIQNVNAAKVELEEVEVDFEKEKEIEEKFEKEFEKEFVKEEEKEKVKEKEKEKVKEKEKEKEKVVEKESIQQNAAKVVLSKAKKLQKKITLEESKPAVKIIVEESDSEKEEEIVAAFTAPVIISEKKPRKPYTRKVVAAKESVAKETKESEVSSPKPKRKYTKKIHAPTIEESAQELIENIESSVPIIKQIEKRAKAVKKKIIIE